MDPKEREKRRRQVDDFWNVDDLIPPRRAYVYPSNTDTAEISFDPPARQEEHLERASAIPPRRESISPAKAAAPVPPEDEYTPENTLLRLVTVTRWRGDYHYYEAFGRDALRLFAVRGVECRRKPFFSYVPQYSQMDLEQLNWYLWWRENVRDGNALDTDYSYIQLYISELLNLSRRMEPLFVQAQLILLWRQYRDTFHQLDSSLPEWICDHGLLHHLPPPELTPGERGLLMYRCRLREYYLPAGSDGPAVEALLAFCNGYDWRKSKFCTAENQPLFDRVIKGALGALRKEYASLEQYFQHAAKEEHSTVRDSYSGCICTAEVKRKIQVSYLSFSRDENLKQLITDAVKYTENRIRMHLSVRSKLTVHALPAGAKTVLDAYFETVLPRRHRPIENREPVTPAYEKLYDLPQKPLSFTAAAEIESSSWQVTQQLVEAFEEEAETANAPTPQVPGPTPKEDPVTLPSNPFSPYLAFLQAVLSCDAVGQRAAAHKAGKLLDLLADELNELAVEETGDILVEADGTAYTLIPDYIETVREILEIK